MFVAVRRVGEPEVVVGMVDYDIVEAVERAAMEVVEDSLGYGCCRVDENQG